MQGARANDNDNDNENRLLPVTTKVHIHNKSMVKHFTATAKGAEALAYGPQQEYIDSYGINTLRPRQNGWHFPDNIVKCIFLNENLWLSLKISLKFVPRGSINNIPALVQVMNGLAPARRQAIVWTNDG